MKGFHIDLEWEESPRVRAPELSATWARLELYADGEPITKVEDHRSRGVRDGIYVPLYPIAEWFVTNWWFLWHEWRAGRPDSRHNLLAARDGFALPDLSFLPTETRMQLVWRSKPASEFDRVSFLFEGTRVVSKDTVREEICSFIDAVTQRLNDRNVAETFLATEWEAILAAEKDPEQKRFCEQAARLGIDPFNPESSIASSLEELDSLLPKTVIDDFCDAVRLNEIPSGVRAIRDFLASLGGGAVGNADWQNLHERFGISNGHTPWQYGYDQARRLRAHLGLKGPIQEDLLSVLRQALDPLDIYPFEAPIGIEAITAPSPDEVASFGITNRVEREESRRFLLCRALSDLLVLHKPSLVTNAQTEHQQRNRAFAAEFLAPAEAIRERLPASHLSEEDVEDLAQEFRVSGFVVRHQIENHKLAVITT
jgi:hypothetical protein